MEGRVGEKKEERRKERKGQRNERRKGVTEREQKVKKGNVSYKEGSRKRREIKKWRLQKIDSVFDLIKVKTYVILMKIYYSNITMIVRGMSRHEMV